VRHFRSILYALVLAPAVWVLVGVGLTHDLTARGRDGFAVESFTGLLLLVLGGAAYGILLFAPISPAGPFLAGVAYLVIGIWAIQAPSAYGGVWPAGVTKPGFDLSRPGYGLAALLAVPMILTVLSARRWAKYEPPVLPIIGQIGRARGAAAAPGMPMAIAQTEVIPRRSYRDSGSGLGIFSEPERTAVLRLPTETANTTAVVVTSPDEPTVVVAVEEPTAVVVSAPEEATVVVVSAPRETTAVVVSAPEEATVVVVSAPEEATAVVAADDGGKTEATAVVAAEPDGEVPTEEVTAGTAERKPAKAAGDRAPSGETTGDERTQAIRLPLGAEPTQAIRTPVADGGEKTQVLRLPPGDPGETTQVFGGPGERTREVPQGDATQVIRTAGTPADGERTQVIRPGLVTPPGESTEAVELSAPDDHPTVSIDTAAMNAAPPMSIAGAERPNFAEDPTGRLVPPAPAGEEPTRTMTVMNLERPPDEVPTQRRPTPDEL